MHTARRTTDQGSKREKGRDGCWGRPCAHSRTSHPHGRRQKECRKMGSETREMEKASTSAVAGYASFAKSTANMRPTRGGFDVGRSVKINADSCQSRLSYGDSCWCVNALKLITITFYRCVRSRRRSFRATTPAAVGSRVLLSSYLSRGNLQSLIYSLKCIKERLHDYHT